MFTSTFANKDMEKFVNFYKRLRIDERNFFVKAIQTFNEENIKYTIPDYVYNPYLKLQFQAEDIFNYCQQMGLERLRINDSFNELVLNFRPFTYHEDGKSQYWQNVETQNKYVND